MRTKAVLAGTVLICLAYAISVAAQFGYPLKGSWSGYWGPTKTENRLLLLFDWDGKTATGILNPGPDAAPMTNIRLDPPAGGVDNADKPWTVHWEADKKDSAGKTIHVTVDGKLDNLGAYRRRMYGSWTEGTAKGEFDVTLN
ncbi:MAG TPA: hypothetical protein VFY29_07095 [Terriglobia bacterium]|nr:hypothetical protein [Terriglobia bacterium]